MNTLYGYLVVLIGAGIGGTVRHAVNRTALPFGSAFPWATFSINVTGSLLMGLVAGWFAFRVDGGQHLHSLTTGATGQYFKLFLTTGVLGGFTTFSAFSLDTVLLWERSQTVSVAVYVGGSVFLSIAALFIGIALMRP